MAAVSAAVETSWSNGQVEEQINRLKMIKRQMDGRAGFALLCARVLPYTPMARPSPENRLRSLHEKCGRAIFAPALTNEENSFNTWV
jgi:hypothetical protein